jgi:hypothetical protein
MNAELIATALKLRQYSQSNPNQVVSGSAQKGERIKLIYWLS